MGQEGVQLYLQARDSFGDTENQNYPPRSLDRVQAYSMTLTQQSRYLNQMPNFAPYSNTPQHYMAQINDYLTNSNHDISRNFGGVNLNTYEVGQNSYLNVVDNEYRYFYYGSAQPLFGLNHEEQNPIIQPNTSVEFPLENYCYSESELQDDFAESVLRPDDHKS